MVASCSDGQEQENNAKAPAKQTLAFEEVTKRSGINHRHEKPVLDHKLDHVMSWVSSVGAAAAAGDYNNDDLIDLYVTNSRKKKPNFLYRNNGDGTFSDVAGQAGLANVNTDAGTSMDCVWGDFDNDGFSDLYVVRWGHDVLFRNNGDGTFRDETAVRFRTRGGAPGTDRANGNAAIFWDYNLDGRLDIYVGNYFKPHDLWNLATTRIMHDDFESSRNGGRNFLYRQESDGTFTEVAESLGVDDSGWTLAVGSADVDNNGWPDLYCADDFGPDQLFLNQGDERLENVTEQAIGLDTKKGMNVDFGDFNNDGWLDIYVTNITTAQYLQEGNMLWHNNGPLSDGAPSFIDVSLESGTYDGGWGWGAKFFDFDNDGDLDIVSVNGFISAGEGNFWYDLASWTVTGEESADAANWPPIGDRSFSGYETTRFFVNYGFGSFVDRAGDLGLTDARDGRGVVTFDYDNDGDLDLFVANQGQPANLYRNAAPRDKHWLTIALRADPATGVNRDAIGARLTVVTPDGKQIREKDGGNGFSGQSDPRLHVGLGDESRVELIEIRWPDGGVQYLEDVKADQILTIEQDPSRYVANSLVAFEKPTPRIRPEDQEPELVIPADLDPLLASAEEQLRAHPADHSLASQYRSQCARYGRHDRAIEFFEELAAKYPDDKSVLIHFSCAYIDKIPTCGGVAAIVCKGSLAKRSLNLLDDVVEANPNSWAAYYCRGMNHLHWPKALLHSDDAAADFEKCIALQIGNEKAHFLRTHVALGDAYAKNEQFEKARDAWREGMKHFPDARKLAERLELQDDASLLSFVEDKRNLQQHVDTDLSFLDLGA